MTAAGGDGTPTPDAGREPFLFAEETSRQTCHDVPPRIRALAERREPHPVRILGTSLFTRGVGTPSPPRGEGTPAGEDTSSPLPPAGHAAREPRCNGTDVICFIDVRPVVMGCP